MFVYFTAGPFLWSVMQLSWLQAPSVLGLSTLSPSVVNKAVSSINYSTAFFKISSFVVLGFICLAVLLISDRLFSHMSVHTMCSAHLGLVCLMEPVLGALSGVQRGTPCSQHSSVPTVSLSSISLPPVDYPICGLSHRILHLDSCFNSGREKREWSSRGVDSWF